MIKNILREVKGFDKIIASCALCLSVLSANQTCVWILHQPILPDQVKKMRKE